MKLFYIYCTVLFFYSCTAQTKYIPNKNNNSLLWEVTGKGLKKSSFLFGTFHLMCKDDIHFSNQLKTAVGNAGVMYMEMDMDDPATMLGGLLLMNMKGGKKLKDLYTPDEYRKIELFFKDTIKMPLAMMQNTKPFFLEALLYPKMMPCKSFSGVEEELMKLAKQNKKEIKGLETMEFQAAVFDSIPYEEQAKELLKTIDSLNQYRKYFDTMLNVYKSQQVMNMDELLSDTEFGMESHQDILLDNRNKNWVNQLKVIMKKESVFVAVGAGHLGGKNGLINLLRLQGYTVKPLLNQ